MPGVRELGNALDRLLQELVRFAECIADGNLPFLQLEQSLVWNDDQSINTVTKLLDAIRCDLGSLRALKVERLGDNCNGENA